MAAPTNGIIPTPNSAEYGAAVTPSDTALILSTRGLWIGTAGNLTVDMAGDVGTVLLSNVPVGVLPVRVVRVRATGTTASGIVALY